MIVALYQVDAFTDKAFGGNPAAVCLLDAPAPEAWMQRLALENNLSETAFLVEVQPSKYALRWFTPAVEVDLCGHATLASAHALWENGHADPAKPLAFATRSGLLAAAPDGQWIQLDFPAKALEPSNNAHQLASLIGAPVSYAGFNGMDFLVEVADAEVVRGLQPDIAGLRRLGVRGVIVTAAGGGESHDFVSRFFAPGAGIDEDPVTGSAHCALAPYWGAKLDKTTMVGYQASARGGIVRVTRRGDRVLLGGQAVTVFQLTPRAAAQPPGK